MLDAGMMRKGTFAVGAAVAVVLLVAWTQGWFDLLARHAVDLQRDLQNALAGAVRQLKAGHAGALIGFVTLCFGYGVVHAIGPGHGKVLLGAYALGNRVAARRLIVVALAASLAQAVFAILLVYAGVLLFSWTRAQMTGMAERSLTAASYLLIGAIGIYLAWRSLRSLSGLWPAKPQDHHHHNHHDHSHDHDGHCCNGHMPSATELSQVGGWRDGVMLVAGVAVRPCSGALLVLVLCWRIGINAAGILGVLAMGLGTAAITIAAALLAVTMREGAWASGLDSATMRSVSGMIGLVLGLLLVVTSAILVRPYLF